MNDQGKNEIGRIRIAEAIKSKLFLIAAIVMTAAAALAFGRIGEGIVQICIFAFTGAVATELFMMRKNAEEGGCTRLGNDVVGMLVIEAVLCFLTAGALLYSVSLVVATFFPVPEFFGASSGTAALISRVTNAVSIATVGAVPEMIAPKVTALILSFAESYGSEKAVTLLSVAVWLTVICLFVGMLTRVASGILLLCSASGLRKAFDMAEGAEGLLSKSSKYLMASGVGITLCSGIPAGGVVMILAGKALLCAQSGNEEKKQDSGHAVEKSEGSMQ